MNDLYAYVNGPWLATHVIPDDRGVDGTFHRLRDDAEADVRAIVEEDTGRAGTLFDSFMDVEGVNAAGMAPLDADLDLLTVPNMATFARRLGELERLGVAAPLTFWVEKASDTRNDSENAIAYLIQSGLGLPDEAYYRQATHAKIVSAYRAHIVAMLGFLDPSRLFGLTPELAAERILTLETELAAGHWDVVATRDAVKTYNPTAWADLPGVIRTILTGAGNRLLLEGGGRSLSMPNAILTVTRQVVMRSPSTSARTGRVSNSRVRRPLPIAGASSPSSAASPARGSWQSLETDPEPGFRYSCALARSLSG